MGGLISAQQSVGNLPGAFTTTPLLIPQHRYHHHHHHSHHYYHGYHRPCGYHHHRHVSPAPLPPPPPPRSSMCRCRRGSAVLLIVFLFHPPGLYHVSLSSRQRCHIAYLNSSTRNRRDDVVRASCSSPCSCSCSCSTFRGFWLGLSIVRSWMSLLLICSGVVAMVLSIYSYCFFILFYLFVSFAPFVFLPGNASGLLVFVCRTCRTQYDGTSFHCLLCLLPGTLLPVCINTIYVCVVVLWPHQSLYLSRRKNRHGQYYSCAGCRRVERKVSCEEHTNTAVGCRSSKTYILT